MTKTLKIGLLVFSLGALLVFIWSKIRAATKLTYQLGTPESIGFTDGALTWVQPLLVTNPTNTGIFIRLIQFDVYLGGIVIGSGFYSNDFLIESAKQSVVKVPCKIGLLGLVASIPDLLSGIKARKVSLNFKGNINAEGFTVGVESPVEFIIPKFSK